MTEQEPSPKSNKSTQIAKSSKSRGGGGRERRRSKVFGALPVEFASDKSSELPSNLEYSNVTERDHDDEDSGSLSGSKDPREGNAEVVEIWIEGPESNRWDALKRTAVKVSTRG